MSLLRSVILSNPVRVLLPQVSDVSALAQLASLQTLYLDGTGVREGSLENLATHSSLSSLSLAGIPVADGNHALQIISGKSVFSCVDGWVFIRNQLHATVMMSGF